MEIMLWVLFDVIMSLLNTAQEPIAWQPERSTMQYAEESTFERDVAAIHAMYDEYYGADDWRDVKEDAGYMQLDAVMDRVLHAPEMKTADFSALFEGISRIHCTPDKRMLVVYLPDIGAKFDAMGQLLFVYQNPDGEVIISEDESGYGSPLGVYQPDETKPYYLVLHNLFTNTNTQVAAAYTVTAERTELRFDELETASDGYLRIFEWAYDEGAQGFYYEYELFVPGYAGASEEEAAEAEQEIIYKGWHDYKDGQFVVRSEE